MLNNTHAHTHTHATSLLRNVSSSHATDSFIKSRGLDVALISNLASAKNSVNAGKYHHIVPDYFQAGQRHAYEEFRWVYC